MWWCSKMDKYEVWVKVVLQLFVKVVICICKSKGTGGKGRAARWFCPMWGQMIRSLQSLHVWLSGSRWVLCQGLMPIFSSATCLKSKPWVLNSLLSSRLYPINRSTNISKVLTTTQLWKQRNTHSLKRTLCWGQVPNDCLMLSMSLCYWFIFSIWHSIMWFLSVFFRLRLYFLYKNLNI